MTYLFWHQSLALLWKLFTCEEKFWSFFFEFFIWIFFQFRSLKCVLEHFSTSTINHRVYKLKGKVAKSVAKLCVSLPYQLFHFFFIINNPLVLVLYVVIYLHIYAFILSLNDFHEHVSKMIKIGVLWFFIHIYVVRWTKIFFFWPKKMDNLVVLCFLVTL